MTAFSRAAGGEKTLPSVCAVVCAAGRGARAGFAKNKLLVPVGAKKETALERTLRALSLPEITEIVVAASAEDKAEISALCARFPRARAVEGGDTRTRSVFNALKSTDCEIVLVHDGARPFVSRETVLRCIFSVLAFGSGVCAVPCTDTVALADGGENSDRGDDGRYGSIDRVLARERAYLLQTPQGFYRRDLLPACEKALCSGKSYTDDSSVYAAFVGAPRLCAGERGNIKLTYKEDFARLCDPCARVGFGTDTHAFGKAQNFVVLAGVKIPSDSGLIAHSDGDVAVHALMDAMLSAAGLNDIGHYFPDGDEKWKGADSMKMLAETRGLLEKAGFAVKNLSLAIQAEKPRLAPYIGEMKATLAAALNLSPDAAGISAGTNEGLGYVGEGKGVTVSAYVLLKELPVLL